MLARRSFQPELAGGSSDPVVQTLSATAVGPNSAQLRLTVDPRGLPANVWFNWELENPSPVDNSAPEPPFGVGTTPTSFAWTVAGLQCESTYYFQAHASGDGGSGSGTVQSFETDSCDGGGTQEIDIIENGSFEGGNGDFWVAGPAFYISGDFPDGAHSGSYYAYLTQPGGSAGNALDGALLSADITIPSSAEDADLKYWARITTSETGSTSSDRLRVFLVENDDELTLAGTLTHLHATGTWQQYSWDIPSRFFGETIQIYFYGETDSSSPTLFRVDDVSLEVEIAAGEAPSVSTLSADLIGATFARLNMTIDPGGAPTVAWFEWDDDTNLSFDTPQIAVGSGDSSQSFSWMLLDLECDTRYYYRAFAENAHDTDDGALRNFRTNDCPAGAPPEADTDPATRIGPFSAQLNGDPRPNGRATTTYFEWGPTTALGRATESEGIGSGNDRVEVQHILEGLDCETTYHFRNYAQNSLGSDTDVTFQFTTASCGAPTPSDDLLLYAERQQCSGDQPAVRLGWELPDSAESTVTVRRSDGGYNAVVESYSQSGMHLVQSGLQAGSSYEFTVEAVVAGELRTSNTVFVPVLNSECAVPVAGGEPPHPPSAWIDDVYCDSGTASVRVKWTDAVGAETYDLERRGDGSPFSENQTFTNVSGNEHIDSGLIPGEDLRYRVKVYNADGDRSSYRMWIHIPDDVCSGPSTPGPFSVDRSDPYCLDGEATIDISWTPATGSVSGVRRNHVRDFQLFGGGTSVSDTSDSVAGFTPGEVARVLVQAESSTAPGTLRSVSVAPVLIPLDVCGHDPEPEFGSGLVRYRRENEALAQQSLIPNGVGRTTYFEYGLSASYGASTPARFVGDGFDWVALGENLSDLQCGTEYHFRLVAESVAGTHYGDDHTFVTRECENDLPQIILTAPSGESELVTDAFEIEWIDSDDDDNASIRLLYSPNDDCSESQELVGDLLEDDDTDAWIWHTITVPEGDYWILAEISDGSATVSDCAGTVRVQRDAVVVVEIVGPGEEILLSEGGGCGPRCHLELPVDSELTLVAQRGFGSQFNRWVGGPCHDSSNPNCTFAVHGDTRMSAFFSSSLFPPDLLGLQINQGDGVLSMWSLDFEGTSSLWRSFPAPPSSIHIASGNVVTDGGNVHYEKAADLLVEGLVVDVFANRGAGGFEHLPVDFSGAANGPLSSLLADIDGDGLDDVLACHRDTSGSRWRIGKSLDDGQFEFRSIVEVTDCDLVLAASDLDLDGLIDLVFEHGPTATPTLMVLLQQESGEFQVAPWEVPELASILDIEPVDIDADGDEDIVVSTHQGVTVLRNDRAGLVLIEQINLGPVEDVVASNFDTDPFPEVVSVGIADLFLLDFRAEEEFPGVLAPIGVTRPKAVAVGDVDADGDVDLAISGCFSVPDADCVDGVQIWESEGENTFVYGSTLSTVLPDALVLDNFRLPNELLFQVTGLGYVEVPSQSLTVSGPDGFGGAIVRSGTEVEVSVVPDSGWELSSIDWGNVGPEDVDVECDSEMICTVRMEYSTFVPIVFVEQGLFSDGFESGDTAAWEQ